jgi:hypothetical protein
VESDSASGYAMAHTADTFLVDAEGRLRHRIWFGAGPEVMAARVNGLATEALAAATAAAPPPPRHRSRRVPLRRAGRATPGVRRSPLAPATTVRSGSSPRSSGPGPTGSS